MIASLKNIAPIILYLFGGIIMIFLSLCGKMYLSLLVLIPLFPLQNVIEQLHQYPMGNQFIDFMLIALILGWVFKAISNREKIFASTPLNKILFLMAIYTYISLWRGSFYFGFPAPISASDLRVQTWKNYIILPLLFFITVNNIKTLKQIKWLIIAMILTMFIMDYYTGNQIKWMSGIISRDKIHGTFVWLGPNELAAFYATYTFVLLGILFFDRVKLRRILLVTAIILNIYCALFLYSRGAYVAILVGFIFISFIKNKKFLIPLIILLLFWQAILPKKVVERINETKTEDGTLDPSSQHRLDMWKQCFNLLKNNPIMGLGFNAIPYLGLTLGDTHNIYVKVLTEQGIIGIAIFLILLFTALKTGWRLYKSAKNMFLKGLGFGFTVCVITTMIVNFFGDRFTYLQLGAYFWVFLGLTARGNIIIQEKLEKRDSSRKQNKSR